MDKGTGTHVKVVLLDPVSKPENLAAILPTVPKIVHCLLLL